MRNSTDTESSGTHSLPFYPSLPWGGFELSGPHSKPISKRQTCSLECRLLYILLLLCMVRAPSGHELMSFSIWRWWAFWHPWWLANQLQTWAGCRFMSWATPSCKPRCREGAGEKEQVKWSSLSLQFRRQWGKRALRATRDICSLSLQ